jgi:hypothetical protein
MKIMLDTDMPIKTSLAVEFGSGAIEVIVGPEYDLTVDMSQICFSDPRGGTVRKCLAVIFRRISPRSPRL